MKRFLIVFLSLLLLNIGGSAWAASQNFPVSVTFNAPTSVSMAIIYWTGRTAPANAINFSLGASGVPTLGKTSWQDADDFKSLDANVGFTASCSGPAGSSLNVACGKMTDGTGHTIPYESADGLTDFFGFSARLEDTSYVAGGPNSMQVFSLTGWSYSFPSGVYGHDFSIYNLLKIPTTVAPGTYATTGTGEFEHLTLTFI